MFRKASFTLLLSTIVVLSAAVLVFYDDPSDVGNFEEDAPVVSNPYEGKIKTQGDIQYVLGKDHGLKGTSRGKDYSEFTLLYKYTGTAKSFTTGKIAGKDVILGSESFRGNEHLETFNLTIDVAVIYFGFLSDCTNLKTINVTSGGFKSYSNVLHSALDNQSRLITYPAGNENTSYTLRSNIKSIRPYAFSGNPYLKTVTLVSNLEDIGSHAFRNCASLENIAIPSNVNSLGANAFEGCTDLGTVTFGNGSKIKTIRDNTFLNCTSLSSIEIPNGVTSIGNGAFKNCSSLTEITIPSSVTSIGANAFEGCTALKTITFDGVGKISSIRDSTFKDCESLTAITIPDSVSSIGANAFEGCVALETISIPVTINITEDTFKDCESLSVLTLTEGTTGMGHNYTVETHEYTPWNKSTATELKVTVSPVLCCIIPD